MTGPVGVPSVDVAAIQARAEAAMDARDTALYAKSYGIGITESHWDRADASARDVPVLVAALASAWSHRSLPPGYVWQDYFSPDEVIRMRDELEARAEAAESRAQVAEAAVGRVEALHQRTVIFEYATACHEPYHVGSHVLVGQIPHLHEECRECVGQIVCSHCGNDWDGDVDWPCRTVAALRGDAT